jgi:hypothetical protein
VNWARKRTYRGRNGKREVRPLRTFKIGPVNEREARESGLWLNAWVATTPAVREASIDLKQNSPGVQKGVRERMSCTVGRTTLQGIADT